MNVDTDMVAYFNWKARDGYQVRGIRARFGYLAAVTSWAKAGPAA